MPVARTSLCGGACKTRKPKDLKTAPRKLWATDTIERLRCTRRLLSPSATRSPTSPWPSRRPQRETAKAHRGGLAPKPLILLSDNGPEFKGAFDQALPRLKATHHYSRSPKWR